MDRYIRVVLELTACCRVPAREGREKVFVVRAGGRSPGEVLCVVVLVSKVDSEVILSVWRTRSREFRCRPSRQGCVDFWWCLCPFHGAFAGKFGRCDVVRCLFVLYLSCVKSCVECTFLQRELLPLRKSKTCNEVDYISF